MIYKTHKPTPVKHGSQDTQCGYCGSKLSNHYWKCEGCVVVANTWTEDGEPNHNCKDHEN